MSLDELNIVKDQDVLILLGETDLNIREFRHIVAFSPLRQQTLRRQGVECALFGDFGPSKVDEGLALDLALHDALDRALHDEAKVSPDLQWAPLAIGQLRWRLSRYRWLKHCFRAVIDKLEVGNITLSSREDADLVHVVKIIATERDCSLHIASGSCDRSLNVMYLLAPYGTPDHLHARVFDYLAAAALRLFHGRDAVFYEPYPNLRNPFSSIRAISFPMIRYLDLPRAAVRKIVRSRRQGVYTPDDTDHDGKRLSLRAGAWCAFPADERIFVAQLLHYFFSQLPQDRIRRIHESLLVYLRILKPRRLVVASDLVSSCRLFIHAAHANGIEVDYLPHGEIFEDYSGTRHDSPFIPDRVLAWSKRSAEGYTAYGWRASAVAHPVMQRAVMPFRTLSSNLSSLHVLVLLPEWNVVSQGGREDSMILGCMQIYDGLISLGVHPENVVIKSHHTAFVETDEVRRAPLRWLQKDGDMPFTLLESNVQVPDILPDYDLVVLGVTTGIYEAILTGTPLVVFGSRAARVGVLETAELPHAYTSGELQGVLRTYDNGRVSLAYKDIADSLQSGDSLVDAVT